jgi:hypothetical protein
MLEKRPEKAVYDDDVTIQQETTIYEMKAENELRCVPWYKWNKNECACVKKSKDEWINRNTSCHLLVAEREIDKQKKRFFEKETLQRKNVRLDLARSLRFVLFLPKKVL